MVKLKDIPGFKEAAPERSTKPEGDANNPYSYGVHRGHNVCHAAMSKLEFTLDRDGLAKIIRNYRNSRQALRCDCALIPEDEELFDGGLADTIIANHPQIARVSKK